MRGTTRSRNWLLSLGCKCDNFVEALTIPDDLAAVLATNQAAQVTFENYSPSTLKLALFRLAAAKRPETRQKRLEKFIVMLNEGKKIYD